MGKRYQSLESWISEALSETKEDKACSAMVLMHVKHNDNEQEIHSIQFKGTQSTEALAKVFQRKAEGFAQDLEGIVNFRLHAFYGSKDNVSTHPLKVMEGEMRSSAGVAVSESPDAKGQTQQLMRHLERREEMMIGFISKVVVEDTNRKATLQEELFQCYELIRKMTMERIELEHNRLLEIEKYKRESEQQKAFMSVIPGLINTIAGTEVVPQSTADTALIEALARNISADQFKMIAGSGLIKNEILMPLMDRFNRVIEKDRKEAEALKRLPPANKNPEMEVQGK